MGFIYKDWRGFAPDAVLQMAHALYTGQRHYNALLKCELAHFALLPVTVLKGPALLDSVYEDWGVRPISDIDLLVSPRREKLLSKALADAGYREMPEKKWRANAHKSVWRKAHGSVELTVEVHTKLFASEPPHFVWHKEHPAGLNPESQLLHLIGHLAHQHTFIKLFWLIDIDRLLKKREGLFDWTQIASMARQLRLGRALDATLFVLNDLLENPYALPPASRRWKYLLDWDLLLSAREKTFSYQLLKHAVKDSWREAIRYDLEWLSARA